MTRTIKPAMIVATLLALLSRPAHATAFSPIQCGSMLSLLHPWEFQSAELEDATDYPGNYANHTHYTRRHFLGNCYMNSVNLNFSSFFTENTFDYLYLKINGATQIGMSGRYSAPIVRSLSTSASFQSQPIQFDFETDYAVNYPGFAVESVATFCGSTCDANYATALPGDRYDGYLLGTNDTVYIKLPASSGPQRVHLWGAEINGYDGKTPTDFDLYAQCNALPTPSSFYARSWNVGSQESIELPGGTCSGGTWYIAVNSYARQGQFRLFFFGGNEGYYYDNFNVGTWYVIDQTDLPIEKQMIMNAVTSIYGATMGKVYVGPTINLYNNGNCDCGWNTRCNLCLSSVCADANHVSNCNYFWPYAPQITLYKDCEYLGCETSPYAWESLRHEMGHCPLGLPDEYLVDSNGQPVATCGHTFMGRTESHVNTFCYDSDPSNHTSPEDHGDDPEPGGTPPVEYAGNVNLGISVSSTPENVVWPSCGRWAGSDPIGTKPFVFTHPDFHIVDK